MLTAKVSAVEKLRIYEETHAGTTYGMIRISCLFPTGACCVVRCLAGVVDK